MTFDTPASFQTFKHTNNQTSKRTNKKVRSKLERNNESQVIKYFTNLKQNNLKPYNKQ